VEGTRCARDQGNGMLEAISKEEEAELI
jgi:hypothetical protein